MKKLMMFGKLFSLVEQRSDEDSVKIEGDKIVVRYRRAPRSLLRDFLAEELYNRLFKVYEEIKGEGKVEVLGDLEFEIVRSIDNRRQRIAKLKGNKIVVKLSAVALPKSALKYLVAHEIAHTFTKRHTKKFWKIVETIYPEYETGQRLLREHEDFLQILY